MPSVYHFFVSILTCFNLMLILSNLVYSAYKVRNLLEPICSGKADTVVGIRLHDRHNHVFRNPRKL